MQWRGPYFVEGHVRANYRVKKGSKTKLYHLNILKWYIATANKVDVVHTSNYNDAAGVIYQNIEPDRGEVPDIDGYHQIEGV